MVKIDLKALCKEKGMKVSGRKDELIQRLLKGEKKLPSRKKSSPKKKKQTSVEKLIKKDIPTIQIRRNNFNNYEHAESGLVFDKDEQIVFGKQSTNDKGESEILELTKEDIEICNKHKWQYRLSENLNDNSFKVSELEGTGEGDSEKSDQFDDITEQDDLIDDDENDLEEFYESD